MSRSVTLLLLSLLLVAPNHVAASGGETIATAPVITSVPYDDAGTTCGHLDDYDVACPATSSAPDVVWAYQPTTDAVVTVDFCGSWYDGKAYVYDGSVDNVVACDDNSCFEGQPRILHLPTYAGHTYYIVMDGSNGACGDYVFALRAEPPPCTVQCPAGAMLENEPPCQDGYQDHYDAGCFGGGWVPVPAQSTCADVCGQACTFLTGGVSYRDEDWYTLVAAGGDVTLLAETEFEAFVYLFYVPHCGPYQYDYVESAPCEPVTLTRAFVEGQEFWIMVVPVWQTGVPPSSYHLNVCGIENVPTPVNHTTWGRIKATYRNEAR
jgi:hypothetical protein